MSQQEAPMAAAKKSKTGKSAPAVKKAVKKVGNARKRVEKRLGR